MLQRNKCLWIKALKLSRWFYKLPLCCARCLEGNPILFAALRKFMVKAILLSFYTFYRRINDYFAMMAEHNDLAAIGPKQFVRNGLKHFV